MLILWFTVFSRILFDSSTCFKLAKVHVVMMTSPIITGQLFWINIPVYLVIISTSRVNKSIPALWNSPFDPMGMAMHIYMRSLMVLINPLCWNNHQINWNEFFDQINIYIYMHVCIPIYIYCSLVLLVFLNYVLLTLMNKYSLILWAGHNWHWFPIKNHVSGGSNNSFTAMVIKFGLILFQTVEWCILPSCAFKMMLFL